ADVHDVHGRVGEHLFQVRVHRPGGGPDKTPHRNPDARQCLRMCPAHEAGTDDRRLCAHVRNRNLSTLPRRSTAAKATATTAMKNTETAPNAGEMAPRRPEYTNTGRVWLSMVTSTWLTTKSVMLSTKTTSAPVTMPGASRGSRTNRNCSTGSA